MLNLGINSNHECSIFLEVQPQFVEQLLQHLWVVLNFVLIDPLFSQKYSADPLWFHHRSSPASEYLGLCLNLIVLHWNLIFTRLILAQNRSEQG